MQTNYKKNGVKKMKPTYDQLQKKVAFYRIFSISMIAFIVFIGMNNLSTTQSAMELERALKKSDNKVLELQLEHEQSIEDCQGYKDANMALIKFCRPCDINKVILKTPLPKMKEV
jgi:hypothetical protein